MDRSSTKRIDLACWFFLEPSDLQIEPVLGNERLAQTLTIMNNLLTGNDFVPVKKLPKKKRQTIEKSLWLA